MAADCSAALSQLTTARGLYCKYCRQLQLRSQYQNIVLEKVQEAFVPTAYHIEFRRYCESQAKVILNPYALSLCLELTLKLVAKHKANTTETELHPNVRPTCCFITTKDFLWIF